jgi:hypothetical protein
VGSKSASAGNFGLKLVQQVLFATFGVQQPPYPHYSNQDFEAVSLMQRQVLGLSDGQVHEQKVF